MKFAGGRPLQMTELAGRLLASPSGITRTADCLERRGLIDWETPRDNRRVIHVALTERGRTAVAAADRMFNEVLRESFSEPLSDEEVQWLTTCSSASAPGERRACPPGSAGTRPGARCGVAVMAGALVIIIQRITRRQRDRHAELLRVPDRPERTLHHRPMAGV